MMPARPCWNGSKPMFAKREDPARRDLFREPARSCAPAEHPSGTGRKWLLVLGILCLAAAAYQLVDQWRRPALPVPEPADPQSLEPQVAAYLQAVIDQTRANPRDPNAHAQLGLAYAANGLWEEARQAFENTAQLAPEDPMPIFYVALALERTDRLREARKQWEQLAERFPDFVHGWYRLGQLALRQKDWLTARTAFEKVSALLPDRIQGPAGLAEALLGAGQVEEAVRRLREALTKHPQSGRLHHLLGLAYQQSGRTNEAARELRLGLAPQEDPLLDPWATQLPLHMRRQQDLTVIAQNLVAAGRSTNALELLSYALELNPTSVVLLTGRGVVQQQLGRPAEAKADLQRALALDTNHVPAWVALCSASLALGDLDAAEQAADHAMSLAPDALQPYLAKANVELARTNGAAALALLRRALPLAPSPARLHIDIGNILYFNQRDPSAALAEFQEAVKLDPSLVVAYVRMAQIHLQAGRTEEALKAIEAARQYAPGDANLASLANSLRQPSPPATNGPTPAEPASP